MHKRSSLGAGRLWPGPNFYARLLPHPQFLLLIATVLGLSVAAYFLPRFPGDLHVTTLVQSVRLEEFRESMDTASYIGRTWPLAAIGGTALGLCWLFRRPRLGLAFCLVWAATGLSIALKEIIGRPRPTGELVAVAKDFGGLSFPSGHALSAMLLFGFLFYLVPFFVKQPVLRLAVQMLFGATILSIGLSRVYLGAHWPSDVVGGYVVGILCLLLFLKVAGRWLGAGLTSQEAQPSPTA